MFADKNEGNTEMFVVGNVPELGKFLKLYRVLEITENHEPYQS